MVRRVGHALSRAQVPRSLIRNSNRRSNPPLAGMLKHLRTRSIIALQRDAAQERGVFLISSLQKRAFRQSTSIARPWGRKSILATRSALVSVLRLLRLSRATIGPYWSLPATEYQSGHKKAARGSLQPELAFPSERKVSGQSTNIARRWGRRSILATRSAPVLRNLRRARVKELAAARGGGCRTRGGSQGRGKGFSRFGYRWRLNRSKGRCRLSSPGSRRGRPPRRFSLSSRRCRIRFRRTPLKPNISRI
jgi:hypothetical protein